MRYTLKTLAMTVLLSYSVVAIASDSLNDVKTDNTPITTTGSTSITEAKSSTASTINDTLITPTLDTPITESESNAATPTIVVYKNPTCECCNRWILHLKKNGFKVSAHDTKNLDPIRDKAKLPHGAEACHTAFVGGYGIEGHVPANDIKRLLKERPKIDGLTVPGMPMGSPGMEMPNGQKDQYDVVTYKGGREIGVFNTYK